MMLVIIAVLFIVLGIAIKNGKMYYLIAGYNTMSKEEQEKYDIEGIATVFRNGMFGMATLLVLGFVLSFWIEHKQLEFYTVIISVLLGITYILVRANSSKFKIK